MDAPTTQDAAAPQHAYERAFDQLASTYDADFTARPDAQAVRRAVWCELDARVRPAQLVVELGCGTGEDARFLAERGVRVVATDLSPAMVQRAREKLRPWPDRAAAVRCDLASAANDLPALFASMPVAATDARVDAVLSNFGALNCVPTLDPLFAVADRLLVPGGWLFACVINRVYLRELARGVLRRFRPNGSLVRCGGERVPLFYHRLEAFRRPGYRIDAVLGLAVVHRDDVRHRFPLNRCGDHTLIVLQRVVATA